MDITDPHQIRIFFEVHSGQAREGPGNGASTRRALELARPLLPTGPAILDVGCGPGVQTLDLAQALPDARLTGVDMHEPFIEIARDRAARGGVADRTTFLRADMSELPFAPGSFDLIWSEGAAYIMGFERALAEWQPLLTPGGVLALTEAVWLTDDRPPELERWWQDGYPDMQTAESRRAQVEAGGYTLIGDFVLPESAWWDDYYTPMQDRLDALERQYRDDEVALSVLKGCRVEISHYRNFAACYGYLFLIMRRANP